MLLLALLFALLAAGTVGRRIRLFATTLLAFAVLAMVTDLALTRLSLYGGPGPFGSLGNTIAGLDGLVALAIGVFTSAALPPGVIVRAERKRPHRDIALLCIVVAAAVAAVLLVKRHWGDLLVLLSKAPLLGGIASALVVFFGLFPGMLYALNITRRCTNRGKHTMLFPVGILVPARNEEGLIGDCVRAIDEAVADYPEQCTVYVVENGSTDRTLEEATGRDTRNQARPRRPAPVRVQGKGVRAQLRAPARDRGDRPPHRRRHAGDPIGALRPDPALR